MHIPKLSPGKRLNLQRPFSSSDALMLARLSAQEIIQKHKVAIITSDASDAQRLMDEMSFFNPDLRSVIFPDWETLPYDSFSPHQDLISERLATLWQISQGEADIVLIPATTALYKIAPPSFLAGYTFHFKVKQKLEESKLRSQLTLAGYSHVSQVISPGEYCVRGGLIDLYPMGSRFPFRIDLFDNEIDSIRTFDPDTQRSLYPVPEVRLLPGREFPMDEDSRAKFRNRWRELLEGDPTRSRIYKDIGNGVATAGIEYFLPLFFDETATVFDYLGKNATVVLHDELEPIFQRFWQDTQDRYKLAQGDPERPALAPVNLFLTSEQFFSQCNQYTQLVLKPKANNSQPLLVQGPTPLLDAEPGANISVGQSEPLSSFSGPLPDLSVHRGAVDPLSQLKLHIANTSNKVLIIAESEGRRASLLDFLRASNVSPPSFESLQEFTQSPETLGIVAANLHYGFHAYDLKIDFVTESELFDAGPTTRRRKKQEQTSDVESLIKDLSELQVGDPVVHSVHGIGRYRGLIHMDLLGVGHSTKESSKEQSNEGSVEDPSNSKVQEYLHLEYADQAMLYVPVSQLHLISRYSGVSASEAPLHRLGSGQWDKAKRKAAEQVRDAAAELLNTYARRALRQGHPFKYSANDYETFANDFGFEETPDQKGAIHAVIQDMISPRPMDRLICGDVGFGKTEVALRAAFVAVMGGKQVALLAPTTLLTEQHFQTLCDRFSKWPIKIAEMSRFRSAKEIKLPWQESRTAQSI